MATLLIEDWHGDAVAQIKVCMRCGAPEFLLRKYTFSWHPIWFYPLIAGSLLCFPFGTIVGVVIALVSIKRREISVPLCAAHRNHWFWQNLLVAGATLTIIVSFLGIVLFEEAVHAAVPLVVRIAMAVLVVLWLAAVATAHTLAIRPEKITERTIKLKNVSKQFVDAYEQPAKQLIATTPADANERWVRGAKAQATSEVRQSQTDSGCENDQPPDSIKRTR
jgi:hypothetical protein